MKIGRSFLLMACAASLFHCSGSRPAHLGVKGDRLVPCPDSPNCVSSQSGDPEHFIDPIACRGSVEIADARFSMSWGPCRGQRSSNPRIVTFMSSSLRRCCGSWMMWNSSSMMPLHSSRYDLPRVSDIRIWASTASGWKRFAANFSAGLKRRRTDEDLRSRFLKDCLNRSEWGMDTPDSTFLPQSFRPTYALQGHYR
jgi:hypothetical protein